MRCMQCLVSFFRYALVNIFIKYVTANIVYFIVLSPQRTLQWRRGLKRVLIKLWINTQLFQEHIQVGIRKFN